LDWSGCLWSQPFTSICWKTWKCMEHYLRSPMCLHVWCSIFHRKILTFFSLSNIFTKSVNRVAKHIISLHLLDQIFEEKVHKNSPPLWRLHPST
jgi:hypothetical protein